ncbi:MAG: S26 family signal peptidase, partial [Myxococcales bacterium]|nr:S26 family signal peptidase [Myxococcales bacterium]
MPELPKWKDTWLNAFKPVVGLTVVVLVGLSTRHSIADHYIVPSGSMEDTIQVGDRILVDKLSLGLRFPCTELEVIAGRSTQRGE